MTANKLSLKPVSRKGDTDNNHGAHIKSWLNYYKEED